MSCHLVRDGTRLFMRSPDSCWVKSTWLRCLVAFPILAGANYVALRQQGTFGYFIALHWWWFLIVAAILLGVQWGAGS